MNTPPVIRKLFGCALLACSLSSAQAVTLVQTSDPGYYNNNIGTVLNLSNPGGDGPSQAFPISNDSSTSFLTPPDLSAASGILGSWLATPWALNASWSATPISVPSNWAVGTEVAVIYQFDTLAATNVVANFGVDNGIFAWLDGNYIFGARAGGGASLGEYSLSLGDFSAGTHYLQLLLEDHGGSNGYAVQITADTFTPGPAVIPTPDGGSTALLLGLTLSALLFRRRCVAANVK